MSSSLSAIRADVLVIGGGLAGFRAAHAARKEGAKVVIAYQARGASQHIIGFNVPRWEAGSEDSAAHYAADTIAGGYGLNDRRLVEAMAGEARRALEELIELGVPLARDGDTILRRHLSGNRFARSVFHPEGIGRLAWQMLVLAAGRLDIECLSGWKALQLLQHEGRAVGAVLSRRDGSERLAVRASAVVLATGGIGALYADSTYPVDITADSYAFALDCGASLVDMEFVQFEPTVVIEPAPCRGMEMPTAMFADGAALRNRDGERFMFRHNPRYGEMQIEKAKIALAVQEEIDCGRGPVRFDTSALAPARLESYVSHYNRLKNAGIDPAEGPVLIKPAAHSHMGGIRIDAGCRTEVVGLLAAGEASGGVHGASRIAGNGASDAIIFGGIAGRSAASQGIPLGHVPWEQVERAALARFEGIREEPAGPGPDDVKDAVRQLMLGSVGIRRTGEDLAEAVAAFGELRRRTAAGFRLERPSDRVRAQEALGFVTIGEVIARSALTRQESRGAHYRIDFPARDDARWLCHVSARRTSAGMIEIGTSAID